MLLFFRQLALTTQTKFQQVKPFKPFKQFKHFRKTQLKTVLLITVLRRLVIVKRSFTCLVLDRQFGKCTFLKKKSEISLVAS